MSQNIWGHNLCEGAKRPSPRERSDRAGGECGRGWGCPPSHGRELFHFSTWNVQSGAYLRRKFRLDDMYYMGKRVTIRPTGKGVFFKNAETYLWKYAPQNNLRKISNTCQRYTKYYITYNINIKEVLRRRNEGTKRTSMERMWGVIPKQFPFITYYMVYGAIYKRQYNDKHVTLSKCMCMRASGASELWKFWHFHIPKLLFLSIFCWYIENKSWFNFIWGGKRPQAPPPPPTSTPVLQVYWYWGFNFISDCVYVTICSINIP